MNRDNNPLICFVVILGASLRGIWGEYLSFRNIRLLSATYKISTRKSTRRRTFEGTFLLSGANIKPEAPPGSRLY